MKAEAWKSSMGAEGLLVDVREPFEFQRENAEGAVNVPLASLVVEDLLQRAAGRKVALICQSGTRAGMAKQKFADNDEVVVIDVGTLAWAQAGLPTVQGKSVMFLERQVRIAAGALVAFGVLLTLLGQGWGIYISGFVGLGLVFAGVTNTCGMAMVLAKMPWNQRVASCEVPVKA